MNDRAFLLSRGWVEAPKSGPWRWTKPEWKPASYYTEKDAVSLEMSLLKYPKEPHGLQR